MNKILPLSLLAILASAALADPLPRDYQILNRKSIFARDRVSRISGFGDRGGRDRGAPRGSSQPVLIGIIEEEDGIAAALEFPDTGKQAQLRIGEALPGNIGTISDITLDYLEFVPAAGQPPTRVLIGQNLQGTVAAVAAAATAAASTTQPTTQPTVGETSAPAAGGGDDLLSQMRRRRQEQMNR